MTQGVSFPDTVGVGNIRLGTIERSGGIKWHQSAFLSSLPEEGVTLHDSADRTFTLYPDLSTLDEVPWLAGTRACLCEEAIEGTSQVSPRTYLLRVVQRCHLLGFDPRVSVQPQFRCLQVNGMADQANMARASRANLALPDLSAPWPLTLTRLFDRLVLFLRERGIRIEDGQGWREQDPGLYEITLSPGAPLAVADQATLLRDGIADIFRQLDLVALFGSLVDGEWIERPRAQIALSLWGQEIEPRNLFWDWERKDEEHMSLLLRRSLAALRAIFPGFASLTIPVLPDVAVKEGIRATAPNRLEARIMQACTGADTNFYIAIAVMLASVLYGIEHDGVWALDQQDKPFDRKSTSYARTAASAYLGEEFVEQYASVFVSA
jgi:glutamine synthetase